MNYKVEFIKSKSNRIEVLNINNSNEKEIKRILKMYCENLGRELIMFKMKKLRNNEKN